MNQCKISTVPKNGLKKTFEATLFNANWYQMFFFLFFFFLITFFIKQFLFAFQSIAKSIKIGQKQKKRQFKFNSIWFEALEEVKV
jgi:hypothetical protein